MREAGCRKPEAWLRRGRLREERLFWDLTSSLPPPNAAPTYRPLASHADGVRHVVQLEGEAAPAHQLEARTVHTAYSHPGHRLWPVDPDQRPTIPHLETDLSDEAIGPRAASANRRARGVGWRRWEAPRVVRRFAAVRGRRLLRHFTEAALLAAAEGTMGYGMLCPAKGLTRRERHIPVAAHVLASERVAGHGDRGGRRARDRASAAGEGLAPAE